MQEKTACKEQFTYSKNPSAIAPLLKVVKLHNS